MSKRITIIGLLMFVITLGIPFESFAADRKTTNKAGVTEEITWEQGKSRGRRGKSYRGYKNYGQYRSSRVGNRRYRWVRRPYYRSGVRYFRTIRVYY